MTKNDFVEELTKLGITCTCEQLILLDKYYELLVEWNEKINLTAIVDYEQVYLKHFYDSLTLFKATDLSKIESLCDVGTGAGFPGLVVKIMFPKIKLTLVDALNKRTVFLAEVVRKLNLENVEIIHARCEEYASKVREKYDVVTARAVANLSMLIEYCAPLVKVGGYFIPMKGNIKNEILESSNASKLLSLELVDTYVFELPLGNGERTLIKYRKTSVANKKFPRRFSDMKKRPL